MTHRWTSVACVAGDALGLAGLVGAIGFAFATGLPGGGDADDILTSDNGHVWGFAISVTVLVPAWLWLLVRTLSRRTWLAVVSMGLPVLVVLPWILLNALYGNHGPLTVAMILLLGTLLLIVPIHLLFQVALSSRVFQCVCWLVTCTWGATYAVARRYMRPGTEGCEPYVPLFVATLATIVFCLLWAHRILRANPGRPAAEVLAESWRAFCSRVFG